MADSEDSLKSKTITYEQFLACAQEFLSYSDALGDGWELRKAGLGPNHVVHYLAKKSTVVLQKATPASACDDEIDIITTEEDEDVGTVDLTSTRRRMTAEESDYTVLTCEYHVIYSSSYQVPVLYFTASYSNGKLALLSDLWQLLPIQGLINENGKWGVLTDIEHPFLHCPFYHIHPCHTAKMMGACDHVTTLGYHDNYVLTWLSAFGPLVGLSLTLEYGKHFDQQYSSHQILIAAADKT